MWLVLKATKCRKICPSIFYIECIGTCWKVSKGKTSCHIFLLLISPKKLHINGHVVLTWISRVFLTFMYLFILGKRSNFHWQKWKNIQWRKLFFPKKKKKGPTKRKGDPNKNQQQDSNPMKSTFSQRGTLTIKNNS